MLHTWDMAEPTSVPELAKELGVKIPDVLRACGTLGLPVRRGAARLTSRQVQRLRRAHADGVVARREPRTRRGSLPRQAKPGALAQPDSTRVPAPFEELSCRVGVDDRQDNEVVTSTGLEAHTI